LAFAFCASLKIFGILYLNRPIYPIPNLSGLSPTFLFLTYSKDYGPKQFRISKMSDISWKDAVLKIIRLRRGREVTLQEIYKEILLLPLVTDELKKPWKNGQPKYQCWIRSSLPPLKREGLITNPKRGVYKSN
jgi:hypothetical protein